MTCKTFFKEVAGGMAEYDSPFDTLATLAEVINCGIRLVVKCAYDVVVY